ncbi:phage tail assembly chaperone [Burkholderia cepacia]|uniref:XkdW family protein n=1 Tax=Burkholderia cepacia TaxID=292 RepID=UPI0007572001|nr:phage tail assembly chaperone [Burkholderia cepacia]KWH56291.1 hypothetical protein WM00_13665 [Burkholderia cepacia]
MQYTHDHLIFTIMKLHPDLLHWRDFKVAMPVQHNGGQNGEPYITEWMRKDIPQPAVQTLRDTFKAHREEICAQLVRHYRDDKLRFTDRYAVAPPDAPESVKAQVTAWQTYRQALRDITKQPDFPLRVEWPTSPNTTSSPTPSV